MDPVALRVLEDVRRLAPPQDQRALNDQLRDLIAIARACGMYDAADFLARAFNRQEAA